MPDRAESLRVLVSEGSSTSAREAITILGLSGHHIEVCDPSPWCLSRFSRLVSRGGFGAHLLDLKSIRVIEGEEFD